MIDVVLEHGQSRRELIRSAVEKMGDVFIERIKSADTIFLHVNLIHHERQLACTHVDAVRGLLDVITLHARPTIIIGDASYTSTVSAFRNYGYERLIDEYASVELVDLNAQPYIDGHSVRKDGSENPVRRAKLASEADLRINLVPVKTHAEVGASLGIESWVFGTWIVPDRIGPNGRVHARWPWLEEQGAWAHHASIARMYADLPFDVSILDGFDAMEGSGPIEGSPVPWRYAVAGMDPVAVDALAASLIGIDPSDLGYIAMLGEQQIGTIDLARINVPPMMIMDAQHAFQLTPYTQEHLRDWRTLSPNIIVSN